MTADLVIEGLSIDLVQLEEDRRAYRELALAALAELATLTRAHDHLRNAHVRLLEEQRRLMASLMRQHEAA